MDPTRQALEAFLADHPDDMAAHAAYADWLIENDDSRGEYIREAIALQDRHLKRRERTRRASALVEYAKQHEAEWLGPLREFGRPNWWPLEALLAAMYSSGCSVQVKWGWIVGAHLPFPEPRLWDAFVNCPVAKLVRHISVDQHPNYHYRDDPTEWIVHLSQFPGLQSLTVSLFEFGDAGVERLLASGILSQLKSLRLNMCRISNDGALALAADPNIRNLKQLDLSWNHITLAGRIALAKVGFRAQSQLPEDHESE